MAATLVDSTIWIDVATDDSRWSPWSRDALRHAADTTVLVINPLIYAEVSVAYASIEVLDTVLAPDIAEREALPFAAGFVAGKAFAQYRQRGGSRPTPLPDFYIGAHAALMGYQLLTRDAARYRTYFPTLEVIAPGPEDAEGT